ncbi:DNA adenine methylase [Pseudobacillus sp. 179-B 2D1 NHS]|uniref:DNA adenine methylase n=1 Tax=Pseudobacillus sp. 179-B 2D1 NHS TaxID=3374292 RepID=UPI0038793C03
MYTCQFCGLESTFESGDFQLDQWNKGFWCESCDGYTYIQEDAVKHRFTLILEERSLNESHIDPPPIKLSKRLSPYRYPGGKSKMINLLYSHLQQAKSKVLVSPFTGGGSFELAMLEAGVVEKLYLNDLDIGVYSLWWVIKYMPYALIDRLQTIVPTHEHFFTAQTAIKQDYVGLNAVEAAWASLLVNRLAYSGIVKANPLGGKNGSQKKLLSRWNPSALIKKIEKIHCLSDHYEITQERAVELIEEAYWQRETTIFIDPPYFKKGKDLYHCYFTKEDHCKLACLLDTLHFGFDGADIVLTYDYERWIEGLYEFPKKEVIGRVYSV